MKTKSFDAVKFMRERRDKLSRKYRKNPNVQNEELLQIRRKYSSLKRTVTNAALKDVRPFAG